MASRNTPVNPLADKTESFGNELADRATQAKDSMSDRARTATRQVDEVVSMAAERLDSAASAVEMKCDRRAVLRCTRIGWAHQPSFESVAPLRKCLRENGASDQISATFDITPDGAARNVMVEGVAASLLPACVQKAVAGLVFPPSDGGTCPQATRMHEILWPPINQPD